MDDVFVSPEAKAIKPYLEPGEGNVFVHYLSPREDRVVAEYTRIINGFLTDETIVINGYDGENGNVSRSIVCYTAENLSKVPDIGNAIENIEQEIQEILESPKASLKSKIFQKTYIFCK